MSFYLIADFQFKTALQFPEQHLNPIKKDSELDFLVQF